MKSKIIVSFIIVMLIITSGFGVTKTVETDSENIENKSDQEVLMGANVLSTGIDSYVEKYVKNKNVNALGTAESKDQSCENGNNYYNLHWTSEHVAQGFKPTMNLFTSLKLYLKRTSSANGFYLVLIRNDSIDNENWLGGFGLIESLSTSGGWVTFTCAEHFVMNPGSTYYIVINLIFSLGPASSMSWRYGNGNPYSRGVAYHTDNDGVNWNKENSWDFNFQSWGISTNPPNPPSNPSPADGAENQDVDVDLSWSCSDPDGDPLTYDIYFGTSTPPALAIPNHPNPSYDPGPLYYDTTYYWKIVPIDSNGAKKQGQVWHFKTLAAPTGPPVVNFVETYYADGSEMSDGLGLLLQGLDLENTYTAYVAGSNVDEVQFVFEFFEPFSQVVTDDDGSDGWNATINMKDILNPFASYKVRAHNDKGWGEYKEYSPKIIPILGWLANYICSLSENESLGYVTFEKGEKDFPAKAKNNYWTLVASIDLSTESPGEDESPVDTEVDVPVEKVGGDYGYSGGVGSSIVICSDGSIDISGGFSAEVDAKSFSGGISANLHGTLLIQEQDGHLQIVWHEMYITINGEVTIPVFCVPLSICGIGVDAGIDITPSVEIIFQFEPIDDPNGGIIPGLGIKLKDDAGISGNVACKVRAYAGLGIFIADFYGEAGGSGTLFFRTPPQEPDGYLENFVLSCYIGGRIRFLFWTAEGWYRYTWSYKGLMDGEEYEEKDWSTIDRDYVTANYNNFVWDDEEEIGHFIEDAFPHAKPSIASFPDSAGSKLMVVWAHDNQNKAKVKGMELQYTIWEKNVGMDNPTAISYTDDDSLQMDPQVAFDKNGNAVCVFVQTDSSVTQNTGYVEAAQKSEIAYCVWDKDSETWSNINTITNNNRMDVQPILGTNDNGEIILMWTSDADCDYPDITLADRSIYYCYWDGGSWSTPEILTSNKQIVTTPQVALKDGTSYGNLVALCTFSMDEDNNPTTTSDQNVYYMFIDQNSIDNTIYQLTTDSYQDSSPSAVYGYNGNPYIVWLKNKYHLEQNTKLYDGALYYQEIGTRSSPQIVTTGRISDPIAISVPGTKNRGDTIFRIGWAQGGSTYTLNYANVTSSRGVQKGAIYGCDSKLSETDWCIAPAGISAATIERPLLHGDNRSCNLSFVYTHGYDVTKPITSCSLIGTLTGYGLDGPQFDSDVTVDFDAFDEGGSNIERTEYRLDYGGWVTYNGNDVTVSSIGDHTVHFRSVDKAGNTEVIKEKIFEIIISNAPFKPTIPSGPTSGIPGKEYTYYTSATDPNGDKVYYMWDWGDEISNWIGPFDSGKSVSAKHQWSSQGTYNIKVRARDVHGAISDWSNSLKVTMEKNRAANNRALSRLFENLLHKFPVLERIIFFYHSR